MTQPYLPGPMTLVYNLFYGLAVRNMHIYIYIHTYIYLVYLSSINTCLYITSISLPAFQCGVFYLFLIFWKLSSSPGIIKEETHLLSAIYHSSGDLRNYLKWQASPCTPYSVVNFNSALMTLVLPYGMKVFLLSGGSTSLKNMQRNRYHKNVSQGILTWKFTSDKLPHKPIYDEDYCYLVPWETAVILHGAEYATPHGEL